MQILNAIFLLSFGFIFLAVGANLLVANAAILARKLGISARLIGLTIIALGTSIPEMTIAFRAGFSGYPGLSVGDIIGSNIVNIGLVLSIALLVFPLELRSVTVKKEWFILFLSLMLVGILMLNRQLGFIDGIILIGCGIVTLLWIIRQGLKSGFFHRDVLSTEYKKEIDIGVSVKEAVLKVILGLMVLPFSAHLIVKQAIWIAQYWHVANITIGLTLSALGTSLPELAATISCIQKRESDIAVGNIIGSNTINLLIVLAIPILIQNVPIGVFMIRDYTVMFLLSLCLFIFTFQRNRIKNHSLKGAFLLSIYIIYLMSIYFVHR
jgi:cation:H+ antiporter